MYVCIFVYIYDYICIIYIYIHIKLNQKGIGQQISGAWRLSPLHSHLGRIAMWSPKKRLRFRVIFWEIDRSSCTCGPSYSRENRASHFVSWSLEGWLKAFCAVAISNNLSFLGCKMLQSLGMSVIFRESISSLLSKATLFVYTCIFILVLMLRHP